jgi:hypothetical protein
MYLMMENKKLSSTFSELSYITSLENHVHDLPYYIVLTKYPNRGSMNKKSLTEWILPRGISQDGVCVELD